MKKIMEKYKTKSEIDWGITILPLIIVILISVVLMAFPNQAGKILSIARDVCVNKLGFFYILLALVVLIIALVLAFSKYGSIKFGNLEKPKYKNFTWGAMIFTSTMAADIVYWALIEWAYYYSASPFGMNDMNLAQKQDMASAYPLFHWGPVPWAFYILPACAYAYMFFVKKRKRQRLSEACRPVIKEHADKKLGKFIDVFAIVGLLAGTATTFSLATPLLAEAIGSVFNIEPNRTLTIGILVVIGAIFVVVVLKGMKAISYLATGCVIVFAVLIGFFLIFGPKVYMIETGITAIGTVINDFFKMATWMDPLRLSSTGGNGFPQDWTIFYWAYWISWFVATPFFIAKISEGRTIKQTILGGLSSGLLGTYTSFIVFGGFGLNLQTSGKVDLAGQLANGAVPSKVILQIFEQIPATKVVLVVLILAMVAFYASTFDAITLIVAGYSEKNLDGDQEPRKGLRAFWASAFLLLPIALLFSESTLSMLQTISIIAALPLGCIMILIIYSFIKELKKDNLEKK